MKPMRDRTARPWGYGALGLTAGLLLSRLPFWPSTPWWVVALVASVGGLLLLGTCGPERRKP